MEIFYHMYCYNDFLERFSRTWSKIVNSGLYDNINAIHINLVGENSSFYLDKLPVHDTKINITNISTDNKSELNTLQLLRSRSKDVDIKLLYLHSKGVTHANDRNVQAWVDYLEHFVIERWRECIQYLETYDTCGVELQESPSYYSGNFWWANTSYIRKLHPVNKLLTTNKDILYHKYPLSNTLFHRYYCEWWLLDNNTCNPYCMHHSGLGDLYNNLYTGYLPTLPSYH